MKNDHKKKIASKTVRELLVCMGKAKVAQFDRLTDKPYIISGHYHLKQHSLYRQY